MANEHTDLSDDNRRGVDRLAVHGAPLTRANLDQERCPCCNDPGHNIEFGQRCHEGAGLVCVYDGGVIYFYCRECEMFIAHVAVAMSLVS